GAGGADAAAGALDTAGPPSGAAAWPGPAVAAPTSFIAGLSTDQVAAATEGAPPAAGNGPQPDPPAGINWPAPGWQQPDNPAWLDGDWASSTAVVPEPGTWLMMLAGLAALCRRAARPG
ncbi:MAG: PEP-CTERM sorting domain-containing protein, partial [Aquabacterium sp.]|nr:PEP-CTERM sorting domain-containing protein [Aquabacterium sp.]